jgi:hypothetical protein
LTWKGLWRLPIALGPAAAMLQRGPSTDIKTTSISEISTSHGIAFVCGQSPPSGRFVVVSVIFELCFARSRYPTSEVAPAVFKVACSLFKVA